MDDDKAVPLLGFKVACLTEIETLGILHKAIDERSPFSALQLNVTNLRMAESDSDLRKAYSNAELVTLDGMGLYLGARILGVRPPEPLTGIGLMLRLLEAASRRGDRFFLLGGTPDVASTASANIISQFGDVIAGYHHGYFDWGDAPHVARAVKACSPQLVFVGMSTPRKEMWIDRWTRYIGAPQLGVGGSLDVLAGERKMAPLWIRRGGLEWMFRLIQEPKRLWRRYLFGNLWFARQILVRYLKQEQS